MIEGAGSSLMGGAMMAAGSIPMIVGALMSAPKRMYAPDLPVLDPTKIQQDTATGNIQTMPEATRLAQKVNIFNQAELDRMLEQALPGARQQVTSNMMSLLRGEIPEDVAGAVMRTSAARSLGGGFGGSPMAFNLTARNLGLTSLDLQQRGLQQFGGLAPMLQAPRFDVSSMFFSPQQRLQFALQDRMERYNRQLLANQLASQPDPKRAAVGQAFQYMGGTMFGAGTGMAADGLGQMGSSMGGGGGFKPKYGPYGGYSQPYLNPAVYQSSPFAYQQAQNYYEGY